MTVLTAFVVRLEPDQEDYGLGMGTVVYSVTAVLASAEIAGQYVRWLVEGHVQAVIAGGAKTAKVTSWDPEASAWKVEAVYEFADRGALDRYVREVAPGLRAEGLAKWGGVEGIRFERRIGERVEQ